MPLKPNQTRNLGVIVIIIIVGIFVGYYTKSEWWGIGGSVVTLFIYISSITAVDWARMRTPALITDNGIKGHNSIIPDDKYTVASPIKGEPNYMILCAGGSGIIELPMHGFGPYYILPEEFVEEVNSATIARGEWMRIKYTNIPRFLQEALSWQVHFNSLTSEIYLAETSSINGSSSPSNIDLASKCARLEEAVNSLITNNEELNKALRSKMHLEKEVNNKIRYVPVPMDNTRRE